MSMRIEKYYLFLILLVYLSPFIDAINGYVMLSNVSLQGTFGSIGQIFKGFMLLLAIFIVPSKYRIIIFIVMAYLVFIELIPVIFHQNIRSFMIGFAYLQKIVFSVSVVMIIYQSIHKIGEMEVIRIFRNGALIYALILIFSTLIGAGFSTYPAGSFGSKGLFASGNGLSIYLGSMSLISIYFYKMEKNIFNLTFCWIILGACVLVGTKASIVFFSFSVLILFFYGSLATKLVFSVVMLSLVFSTSVVNDASKVVFDVIWHRYENSENIFVFLASARDGFVADAFQEFNIQSFYILRVIFGLGIYMSFRDFSGDISIYDTLETDFFDVFFAYGVIGLMGYLFVFLHGVYISLVRKKYALAFCFIPTYAYSLIAGHILFNSMSIIPLLLVYALLLNSNSVKIDA